MELRAVYRFKSSTYTWRGRPVSSFLPPHPSKLWQKYAIHSCSDVAMSLSRSYPIADCGASSALPSAQSSLKGCPSFHARPRTEPPHTRLLHIVAVSTPRLPCLDRPLPPHLVTWPPNGQRAGYGWACTSSARRRCKSQAAKNCCLKRRLASAYAGPLL